MNNAIQTSSSVFNPGRGRFISSKNPQSGPFSLLHNGSELVLGYNSKIRFGNNFSSLLVYDLSFRTAKPIKNSYLVCEIRYLDGIPVSADLVNSSGPVSDIEYIPEAKWPHPKNVLKTSFIVAEILPYNENLLNTYGEAVLLLTKINNNGNIDQSRSFSAIRHVYTAVQTVQTCYGFIHLTSPYI